MKWLWKENNFASKDTKHIYIFFVIFDIFFLSFFFFKLKAVIVDTNLQELVHAEVKFDTDLPEFRTNGGVNAGQNKNE